MKTNRLLLTAVATLTVLATSAFAFAQSEVSHENEQRLMRRVIARVGARLNITSEQRLQVKAILKAEEPTVVALEAQAKQEREAMTALPAYNEAEVRDIAQKYAATNTDIVVERAKIRLELRAVLTEQQIQRIEQFQSKRGGHFEERLDSVIGQL
jgi:Spy/CpxP family protein refolding chaperone